MNWMLKNADASDMASIAYKFRKKRMSEFEKFYKSISDSAGGSILDLGGTFDFWKTLEFNGLNTENITLLNLEKQQIPKEYPNILSVVGDATNLKEYGDHQFDLVFSNSVIEHVGDFRAQKRMAREVVRVGKHYYLQTPNRYFPLEPHYLIPFFQFFPLKLKAFLIRHWRIGHKPRASSNADALKIAKSVRLLSKNELKKLFPNAKINEERFGLLTKSFILYF